MKLNYNERLPINDQKHAEDIILGGIVKNRKNLVVEEEHRFESGAEIVLRYTGHQDADTTARHIVISAENGEITINCLADWNGRAPGLRVAIKSKVRNIRATLAGRVNAEA